MAMSSIMMFAPTEKCCASLVITNASKFAPSSDPGFNVELTICTMSPPSEFILEWNSRHATPSPRSTSEAPGFDFTTFIPPRFAAATDQTPPEVGTGLWPWNSKSKYDLPEGTSRCGSYQL